MRDAVSQHLYTYWNEIRGSRLAPKRFEIEPSRISAILPDTFVLERIDTATSRFRLAGTRICEAFAAEFRGLNIMDMFGDEDRITLERQCAVRQQPTAEEIAEVAREVVDDFMKAFLRQK